MAIEFSQLKKSKQKSKRRLGRGLGSGRGTTAGRGQKGQKSRSGVSGLKQLGLKKTLLATPKLRGFKSSATKPEAVNIDAIAANFTANETVTPKTLKKKGLIRNELSGAKILGRGSITIPVKVQNCTVSAAAEKAITAAGGVITK